MIYQNPTNCIYCSTPFGTTVIWHNKQRTLYRVRDHFTPKSAGGKRGDNLVWCCQICNLIKSDKVFNNGTEAQNYILDKLLRSNWKILE